MGSRKFERYCRMSDRTAVVRTAFVEGRTDYVRMADAVDFARTGFAEALID